MTILEAAYSVIHDLRLYATPVDTLDTWFSHEPNHELSVVVIASRVHQLTRVPAPEIIRVLNIHWNELDALLKA